MLGTSSMKVTCGLMVLCLGFAAGAARNFPSIPFAPQVNIPSPSRSPVWLLVCNRSKPCEQKTYFGAELTPKGFIPVFVVIQNGSSGDSFLFEKSNVGYAGVSSDSAPKMQSKVGESLGMLGPGLIAMKLITNATEVQENLLKKEVQSKTLSPGTSVHGFLYIPVPKRASATRSTFRFRSLRPGQAKHTF